MPVACLYNFFRIGLTVKSMDVNIRKLNGPTIVSYIFLPVHLIFPDEFN